jgi:CHASE3 domain sensor protein
LTGDQEFLSSFETSLRSVKEQESGLEQLIHDNQAQTARLSALESLIAERVELSRRTVESRQRSGFEAARAAVTQGTGKEVMDAAGAQRNAAKKVI